MAMHTDFTNMTNTSWSMTSTDHQTHTSLLLLLANQDCSNIWKSPISRECGLLASKTAGRINGLQSFFVSDDRLLSEFD